MYGYALWLEESAIVYGSDEGETCRNGNIECECAQFEVERIATLGKVVVGIDRLTFVNDEISRQRHDSQTSHNRACKQNRLLVKENLQSSRGYVALWHGCNSSIDTIDLLTQSH